ncbi:uncharacterized protein [Medicago truncatula]|uniref:uncharacterized protein n=1 Tax=Medicago truncatula TaxID=3880 RepID=UPI0019681409|nr:uncharacterized protein LOC120576788 [Medicago truncatula]
MFFVGESKFEITLEDRFRRRMANPRFTPSMKFEIDKDMLPFLMIDDVPRPYVHDPMNFQFSYEKKLTGDEIDSGWLILAAGGFCRLTLNKRSTSVKLVDDFGNAWFCTLVYGRRKYAHFKIGGSWRRMVKARGLQRGSHLILGAPKLGSNDTVYFSLIC